jgi:acetyl esterase/lipase
LSHAFTGRRAMAHSLVLSRCMEVHGGAWIGNDRLTNVDIDQALAASGVVVMAVDFRMPPAA